MLHLTLPKFVKWDTKSELASRIYSLKVGAGLILFCVPSVEPGTSDLQFSVSVFQEFILRGKKTIQAIQRMYK